MTAKKILAYIFILLAMLLIIAFIGQINKAFSAIVGFFIIFTGRLSATAAGEATGHFIYWCVHILAIFFLIKYARKWLSKKD